MRFEAGAATVGFGGLRNGISPSGMGFGPLISHYASDKFPNETKDIGPTTSSPCKTCKFRILRVSHS
jgi:hypothetical protein